MKTILNLKKSIFFVAALTTVISFTSCSSDDDDPKPLAVTDVYGSYKGKMSVTTNDATESRSTGGESSTKIDVTATVNNDTIHFESFPVETIIAAIEGEEDAAEIVKSMDKVDFKVGYKSKLNQAMDSVSLTLDPKPMEFTYKVTEGEDELEKNVKVIISTLEDEKSAYSAKVLKFNLKASEIKVDDEEIDPFAPIFYSFDLNKQ